MEERSCLREESLEREEKRKKKKGEEMEILDWGGMQGIYR